MEHGLGDEIAHLNRKNILKNAFYITKA